MARIRSVKPELRRDLTVAEWPRDCRYAWVLLWGYLDDHGRGLDDLRLLVADLFPLDRDVTERKLDGWLTRMATDSVHGDAPLCRYTVGGRRFLHAPKWTKSQRVSHPQDSLIPRCPIHESDGSRTGAETEPIPSDSGTDPESFRPSRTPEDLGVKGAREAEGGTATPPEPSRLDVEQVCSALVAAVVANGARKPTVTQTWRREARLLLDKDARPLAEVLAVIAWATQDSFWKSNILSVPTLREKYDRLRIQAEERSQLRPTATDPHDEWGFS